MKNVVWTLILLATLASCNRNPHKVNVSNVSATVTIRHLDMDLLKLNQEQLQNEVPKLKSSYGEFFDIFTYRMIGIGGTETPDFAQSLNSFVNDTLVRRLTQLVPQKVDTVALRAATEDAFKHYKYYFPAKQIPTIYTCISGFNQSVVVSQNLIGVSLDKYLGADCKYYQELGLPAYKRRNMHQQKIVADMMYAWADAEWPKSDRENTLLSNMIHQGKLQYFLDAVLPEMHDTLKFGITARQLDFCAKNEAKMWTYMAENKMLFTTDRMSIKRFIDDAPYTASFSEESPGRTGVWLGGQIVRSYMKAHPDVKLPDLMNNSNYQEILNQSEYQPK